MSSQRNLFLEKVGQTSLEPLAIQMTKAEGCKLFDIDNKPYIDLIGGISVSNIGYSHPKVINAIQTQAEKFLHIMVYGELVQSPQVEYADLLTKYLPENLNNVYFTNSGAEAVEGAMKLAKRYTSKTKIIGAKNSYHGSTQGALSLLGDEYFRNAYRPLLPEIYHLNYNNFDDLELIDKNTAAIILEPVQAEAGVILPDVKWLKAVREKCNETGCLLIFDEIQTGFGRIGTLFAFQKWGIVPDILLLGKALGGGMPLGAFISSKEIMTHLAHSPILGHITTFGGHPISCAAGKAAFEVLLEGEYFKLAEKKAKLFQSLLIHPKILAVRNCGLMMAVELKDFDSIKKLIQILLNRPNLSVFTDWFLFASNSFRIVPPLTISNEEITQSCELILESLNKL